METQSTPEGAPDTTGREQGERKRGLDEVSSQARSRIKRIKSARREMEVADRQLGGVPGREVVRALLSAAYKETERSWRKVLDKEQVRAKRAAQRWARAALDDPLTVILDTETTGLHGEVDFLEIAVIDRDGNTLFDSRVRPISYIEEYEMVGDEKPLPYRDAPRTAEERLAESVEAFGGYAAKTDTYRADGTRIRHIRREAVSCSHGALAVHGIREEDVVAAPSFAKAYPSLVAALAGKRVVVYATAYDGRVWAQTVERYRLDPSGVDPEEWECAMKAYAGYRGEYRYEYPYEGRDPDFIPESFSWQKLYGSHRALGDCRATLKRVHEMAGREMPELPEMPPVSPVPRRVQGAPPRRRREPLDVSASDFEDVPF